MFHLVGILQVWPGVWSLNSVTVGNKNIRRTTILEFWPLPIECVRSCDQKPYLHNETKGGICIKTEFNPQKNSSLLQDGRRFSVYSSKMAAVTSCEHTSELTQPRLRRQQERHKFAYLIVKNNSFARFARAGFIFDISQTFSFFLRREMTCFAVV